MYQISNNGILKELTNRRLQQSSASFWNQKLRIHSLEDEYRGNDCWLAFSWTDCLVKRGELIRVGGHFQLHTENIKNECLLYVFTPIKCMIVLGKHQLQRLTKVS